MAAGWTVWFCVVSVGAVFVITGVTACKCKPPTYTQYCTADYVLKAAVKREVKVPHKNGTRFLSRAYRMRVLNVYKFPGIEAADVDMARVFTSETRGACGVTLDRYRYVLTGYVDKTKTPYRLTVSTCNFFKKWPSLNTTEKHFIKDPEC